MHILMTNTPKRSALATASGDLAVPLLKKEAEQIAIARGEILTSWQQGMLYTYKDTQRTIPAGLYWIESVPHLD